MRTPEEMSTFLLLLISGLRLSVIFSRSQWFPCRHSIYNEVFLIFSRKREKRRREGNQKDMQREEEKGEGGGWRDEHLGF